MLFRALLLHGLVSKARLPAPLAAALSSAVFGAMHIWNERSAVQRSIYAAWTFLGGWRFGGAVRLALAARGFRCNRFDDAAAHASLRHFGF